MSRRPLPMPSVPGKIVVQRMPGIAPALITPRWAWWASRPDDVWDRRGYAFTRRGAFRAADRRLRARARAEARPPDSETTCRPERFVPPPPPVVDADAPWPDYDG
jgi:hypothetical protein